MQRNEDDLLNVVIQDFRMNVCGDLLDSEQYIVITKIGKDILVSYSSRNDAIELAETLNKAIDTMRI